MLDEFMHLMMQRARQEFDVKLLAWGHICNYDPDAHAVKVLIPTFVSSDGQMMVTPWMPLGTPWAGNGYGLQVAPKGSATPDDLTAGELVLILMIEQEQGPSVVATMFYADQLPPPSQLLPEGAELKRGEALVRHESGSVIYLREGGQVEVAAASQLDMVAPIVNIAGNVVNIGGDNVGIAARENLVVTAKDLLAYATDHAQVSSKFTHLSAAISMTLTAADMALMADNTVLIDGGDRTYITGDKINIFTASGYQVPSEEWTRYTPPAWTINIGTGGVAGQAQFWNVPGYRGGDAIFGTRRRRMFQLSLEQSPVFNPYAPTEDFDQQITGEGFRTFFVPGYSVSCSDASAGEIRLCGNVIHNFAFTNFRAIGGQINISTDGAVSDVGAKHIRIKAKDSSSRIELHSPGGPIDIVSRTTFTASTGATVRVEASNTNGNLKLFGKQVNIANNEAISNVGDNKIAITSGGDMPVSAGGQLALNGVNSVLAYQGSSPGTQFLSITLTDSILSGPNVSLTGTANVKLAATVNLDMRGGSLVRLYKGTVFSSAVSHVEFTGTDATFNGASDAYLQANDDVFVNCPDLIEITGGKMAVSTGVPATPVLGEIIMTCPTAATIKLGDVNTSTFKKLITEDLVNLFNNHVHSGVSTGTGNSGAPTTQMTSTHQTQRVKAA